MNKCLKPCHPQSPVVELPMHWPVTVSTWTRSVRGHPGGHALLKTREQANGALDSTEPWQMVLRRLQAAVCHLSFDCTLGSYPRQLHSPGAGHVASLHGGVGMGKSGQALEFPPPGAVPKSYPLTCTGRWAVC